MKKSPRTKRTAARKGTPALAPTARRHQISVAKDFHKSWDAARKHCKKQGLSFSGYVAGLVAQDMVAN